MTPQLHSLTTPAQFPNPDDVKRRQLLYLGYFIFSLYKRRNRRHIVHLYKHWNNCCLAPTSSVNTHCTHNHIFFPSPISTSHLLSSEIPKNDMWPLKNKKQSPKCKQRKWLLCESLVWKSGVVVAGSRRGQRGRQWAGTPPGAHEAHTPPHTLISCPSLLYR